MVKDLVSVLIPTYNRKGIVEEAINCALSQTYENIEIIVVDNCSTDGSYEFLKEKYKYNKTVKIYRNEKNLGPVKNWMKCLEYAEGEFCKILWSDDLMEETFIEKAVNILRDEKDVAFVYSQVVVVQLGSIRKYGEKSFSLEQRGKYEKDIFIERSCRVLNSVPPSPGCALFRTKDIRIIDKIPNGMGIDHSMTGAGTDVLIFWFAAAKYKYVYCIDEVLNCFRGHNGSISCSGIDLYCSYLIAQLYFVNQVLSNRKYRKILLENLVTYCFGKRKNILETFNIIRKCDKTVSIAEFVMIYLKMIIKA